MIAVKIERQNFELIQDRIGAIIRAEIDNQAAQFYNTDCEGITVYSEVSTIDKIDLPAITVSCTSGAYGNQHAGYAEGIYVYTVSVFTNAKATPTETGEALSMYKRNRISGIVRAILENPIYKTLGFEPDFIGYVRVSSFEFGNVAKGENDSLSTKGGSLIITVKASEESALIDAPELEEAITRVILNESESGYKYEYYA